MSEARSLQLPQLEGQDKLTHSRMSCKRRCSREHFYKYVRGWRPNGDAKPLRMGNVAHDAFDLRAQGKEIFAAVGQATSIYNIKPEWADPHMWDVERETLISTLTQYFDMWEADDRVAEYIASEVEFNLPIINPTTGSASRTYRVAGKIDKIVRLKDGRLAVMEHKTTGEDISPASKYWTRLELDQQISLYMIAAKAQGYDVETVLYDVTRKPTIKPKKVPLTDGDGFKIVLDVDGERVYLDNGKPRQSADKAKDWELQSRIESPMEFGDRLTQDIKDRPEFYFARREIPRLSDDLDEFRHELWEQAQDMMAAQRHGRHYRNTNACTMFSGCAFLDICRNGLTLDEAPTGFTQLDHVHPELSHASTS